MDKLAFQVRRNEDLFAAMRPNMEASDVGYSHRHIEMMNLRITPFHDDVNTNPESLKKATDELFAYNTAMYSVMSEIKPFVYWIMSAVGGTHLGRVTIARLPAGCGVDAHYDTGLSTEFYERYHVIINGAPGNVFSCGEPFEDVEMLTGEIWWMNSRLLHSMNNASNEPRIHINVDVASL